jgi:Fic family protein
MRQNKVDHNEVVRLYLVEELSVREIADRLGSNYAKIYHILRGRVEMRPPAEERARRTSRKHQEVTETIRQRIVTGDWKPRHKILAYHELAQVLGVGELTVKRALAELQQRGYVRTLPHKGTYVRPRQFWQYEAASVVPPNQP